MLLFTATSFAKENKFECSVYNEYIDADIGFKFIVKKNTDGEYSAKIKPVGFTAEYAYSKQYTTLSEFGRYSGMGGPLAMCATEQKAIVLSGSDKKNNLYHVQFCVGEEESATSIDSSGDRGPFVSVNDRSQQWPSDASDYWEDCN